ncbi:hypothetical protein RDWZM_007849 [Blomia tropicalis]|uniref:Suppressor of cytokine signaling 7 n=1 Tax=Blomia tropicalis TaxID=40697 RepID=A0A9Q0M3A0_BLOTA|nr:hypothetical protein RDWZM_007849 [Blomia tropicalis]
MSNQANKPKFLMDTNQDPERVADMLVRYQLISKENNLRTQVEEDIPPQNNRIDDTEFFASGPFYAHLDDEVEDDEIVNSINNRTMVKTSFDDIDRQERHSNTKCNVLYAEVPHPSPSTSSTEMINNHEQPLVKVQHSQTSNGGKLKFKSLLMFGNGKSSSPSIANCDDSCSCCNDGKSTSKHNHQRKIPFSPKIRTPFNRILSSSQELFSKHTKQPASYSTAIRVIKPTAIRPNPPNLDSRPSTSVDFYQEKNHNSNPLPQHKRTVSAFHQVTSSSVENNQHCRSNSLAEPFVYDLNSTQNGRQQIVSNEQKQTNTSRPSFNTQHEPIHMTLEEVRRIAFGSESETHVNTSSSSMNSCDTANSTQHDSSKSTPKHTNHQQSTKSKLKLAFENILHKTHCIGPNSPGTSTSSSSASSPSSVSSSSKNVYQVNPQSSINHEQLFSFIPNGYRRIDIEDQNPISSPFIRRALPPVPRNGTVPKQNGSQAETTETFNVNSDELNNNGQTRSQKYQTLLAALGSNRQIQLSSMSDEERQRFLDYATSIERVKNCGWYWGPVCGEMAEKLLETEPCGSFIVRDSSDEHYIFSLTFKLNGVVRHVRIEHDQGNFSFGSLQKYRSNTIVDFIESAVEHSRSGQFLFFLHRHSNGNLMEPVLPVRVQLLNPISRFRQVQSLQHNCRFTILKHVRRDQIQQLPLPEYIRNYLDTPYYYSEELANLQETIKHEKLEGKKEEEKRRKLFMKTDQRTLVSAMLADRTELERRLNIVLPPEQEVYGLPNENDTTADQNDTEDQEYEFENSNPNGLIEEAIENLVHGMIQRENGEDQDESETL